MPKYLFTGSYTLDGVKGVLKEGGTSRRQTVQRAFESVDGKMEAFYYAFGEDDFFITVDLPNNATAAALSLFVTSTGAANVRTIPLITPEEVDEATKKRINYRPPGQ